LNPEDIKKTGVTSQLFSDPRDVKSVDGCLFYHTMDLPGHGTVKGYWDLRGRIHDYIGHVDVIGRRVLDVGAASGFLSFEMEKLGAEVVSFDADCAERYAFVPIPDRMFTTDYAQWKKDTNKFIESLQKAYWFAHRSYGSKAKAYYGDIYDLPSELGQFDVALVGQILIHLRDPVSALASVARRCSDTLVVTECLLETEDPIGRLGAAADSGPEWLWWQCSIGLIRQVMRIAGFQVVAIHRQSYRCDHPPFLSGNVKLVTVVGRRQISNDNINTVKRARILSIMEKRLARLRSAWHVIRGQAPF